MRGRGKDGEENMLPREFKNRMKKMLGEEYAAFEASYQEKHCQALRVNPLKAGREFLERGLFSLRPVPWAKDGYYYGEGDAPGKHPYHEAGVYYIQEPSAMAPAEYLDVRPGERALDLCAAPGGKSAQLAARMKGEGILVCNEIHPARARVLSENVERMGICNAIVMNETPQRLSMAFAGYFDKILVDAPCSGEGMFRKNEAACEEWSENRVDLCAARQDEILACAAEMLAPGGKLAYSTCTFAPKENEGSVSRFLKRFPEFEIVPLEKTDGMTGGRADWIKGAAPGIEGTIRLFPHKLPGEGHYLAVLQKGGEGGRRMAKGGEEAGILEKDCREWTDFCKRNLNGAPKGIYTAFGDQLYILPYHAPSLKGLKTLRPGLHLGTKKKNRLAPSHALALCLAPDMACRCMDLPSGGKDILAYLNGQAIPSGSDAGWNLIAVDGYGIGWGKCSGGMMKNHYPKGLRKHFG